jgi:hypothetical protein
MKEPYAYEDLAERLVRTPLYGSPSHATTSYSHTSRLHLGNASRWRLHAPLHACMHARIMLLTAYTCLAVSRAAQLSQAGS